MHRRSAVFFMNSPAGLLTLVFLLFTLLSASPGLAQLLAPEVEFLGPEQVKSSKETIGFIIKANPGTLDPANTYILLDGAKVNSIYDSTRGIVRWTPTSQLQSRNYTATLKITNTNGSVFGFDATFTVLPSFDFTGSLPWPNPCRQTTLNFRYTLTAIPEEIWLKVYDLSENVVVKKEIIPGEGIQDYSWDCSYEDGTRVPYGSYYYVLEARNYDGTTAKSTGRFTLLPR